MPDNLRNRDWLETEEHESSTPGLPRPDLNPLVNPLLGKNMGRWAQVYFTSPPDQRERAVEKLVQELQRESGGKKPAPLEAPRISERPLPRPGGRAETEFPEVPIPASSEDAPEPSPIHSDDDLVVCSGCLHKNAAEQRFCGICGTALSQEIGRKPYAAPQPAAQATSPAENPESDWGWLRERTLSSYDVNAETKNNSRIVVGVILVLVVAVGGGYLLWQNRARIAHEQAPASAATVSEPSSAPSVNLPIATPSATGVQQAPQAKPETNLATPKASEPPGQDRAKAESVDSSVVSPSEDGRPELDQARRYLGGEGVPRSSWMASQFLWKAIAKQNSEAVLLLSDLYARGDGVPHSCEQARVLLVSAAKKGSSAAAQKLRSVETSCR